MIAVNFVFINYYLTPDRLRDSRRGECKVFYYPFGCTSLEVTEVRESLFLVLEVFRFVLRFKLKAQNKPKRWLTNKGSDVFWVLNCLFAFVIALGKCGQEPAYPYRRIGTI